MPRLAVLGHPVAHSRSPAMQNAALAELGLGGEWTYEAIEVEPERLRGARRARCPATGFAGVNVTVPHKLAALALADRASEAARAIGAANTLSFAGGEIARREHRRRRDHRGAPEPPDGHAGAGARRRRSARAGDLGAARGRRRGRDLEPHRGEGARRSPPSSAPSRRASRRQLDAGDFDLLVNATTVGLEQAGHACARRLQT